MATTRIVPAFNKDKDFHASFSKCAESLPIEELACECGEEAFTHRVVIAVTNHPIDGRTLALRQRWPKAKDVYCDPWSE